MEDTTHLMFNVNVKVEECEDVMDSQSMDEEDMHPTVPAQNKQDVGNDKDTDVICIDDSDDENEISDSPISMDVSKYNQGCNIEEVPAPSNEVECETISLSTYDSGNEKKYYFIRRGLLYTFTKDTILKAIEEQSKLLVKTSDFYLNNAIRRYHHNTIEFPKSFHEKLIDNAIEQWMLWYQNWSRIRDTPLIYKCYLCNKGWWRLKPFRDHIKDHKNPNLKVVLEEVYHETNIVANVGVPTKIRPVPVATNCWRCNKSARHHQTSAKNYKCEQCQTTWYTCAALAQHVSTCKPYLNMHGVETSPGKLCTICCLYCPTQQKLDNHMHMYHIPRSDDPSYIRTKTCGMCKGTYHVLAFHDCPKQRKIHKCLICFNRFMSRTLLHLHMAMNRGFSSCPDCSKKYKDCYLLEHMLQHSSNYDMVQYCMKCSNNVLYRNKKRFQKHIFVHGNASQRRRWGAKMLLPLKCIKGEIIDSIERLDIEDDKLYERLDQLDVPGLVPREIAALIRSNNGIKDVIQTDDNSKPLSEEPDEMKESDYELDNYAFQIQLDAEIQRDIEIEAEISKVFKASNCYQKFLEKETNEPIDDVYEDDVCILDKPKAIFIISDSDSEDDSTQIKETSKPKITESVKQKESDSKRKRYEETDTSNLNYNSEIKKEVDISDIEPVDCASRIERPVTNDSIEVEEASFNDNITVKIESCESFIEEQSNDSPKVTFTNIGTENIGSGHLDNIKKEPVSKHILENNSQDSSNVEGSKVNSNSITTESRSDRDSRFVKTSSVTSISKHVPSCSTRTEIRKENLYSDIKIKEEIDCSDVDDESVINFLKGAQQLDFNSDIKLEANSCVSDGDIKNEVDLNENQEDEDEINHDWNLNFEEEETNVAGTSKNDKSTVKRNEKRKYSETSAAYPLCKNERHDTNVDEVLFTCKKCPYSGPYKQCLEHIAAKCPAKEVTCTYCSKAFANIKLYLQHLAEHNLRYLACPECGQNFNIVAVLVDHVTKHICDLFLDVPAEPNRDVDSRINVCRSCEELVETENYFSHWESHLDLNVGGNIKSNGLSDDEVELKSLMSPETVEKVLDILVSESTWRKCIVCSKCSVRKSDIKRHLIEHLLHEARVSSGNLNSLCCPICQLHIQTVMKWREHMREHANLKIYHCDICLKSFSDSSNYCKHRKIHNEFRYICDHCGGKFRAKNGIIKHLVSEKVFGKCSDVSNNEQSEGDGDFSPTDGSDYISDSGDKNQYVRKKSVHEQNPVSCSECQQTFYAESCLRKHIRMKHTPHSYLCGICRKRFSTLKEQWTHMWEKHKQRKLAADCPICKKEYRRIVDVRYHMRLQHGIQKTDIKYKTLKYRKIQKEDKVTEENRAEVTGKKGTGDWCV